MSIDSQFPEELAKQTVVADATATHAAESSHDHEPPHLNCLNCGTPLRGHYCHACGQHDFDFHRSFWHVFLEALENFLHFDTKLFRNIHTLMFRPGRLSAEFNAGKRASQMPPFRLYVFTAFVFFVILFSGGASSSEPAFDSTEPASTDAPAANVGKDPEGLSDIFKNAATRAVENTKAANAAAAKRAAEKPGDDAEPAPAAQPAVNEDENPEFVRWVEARGKYAYAHQKEFGSAVLHAIPKLMLVCLPFFALFTRVLFRKSGQVYLQHLVVALHFHTFFYLWILFTKGWTALVGLPSWGPAGLVLFVCNLWMVAYPFVMLRTLYGNSWFKTAVKTGLLACAYGTTLALGFGAVALIYFAWL